MQSVEEMDDAGRYKRLMSGAFWKAARRIANAKSKHVGVNLTDEQALLMVARELEQEAVNDQRNRTMPSDQPQRPIARPDVPSEA